MRLNEWKKENRGDLDRLAIFAMFLIGCVLLVLRPWAMF